MSKSILIGNGINIAFSKNDDYKNYAIIERFTKYLSTDRYDDVFNYSISASELGAMLNELNDFFQTRLMNITALRLAENEEEMKTLIDISQRYHSKSKDLLSVGIEDYFFVMKMVFNLCGDEETPLNALYDGLKYLFLDSIYNDGKIETLYQSMDKYAQELKKYDTILTVNYDNNLNKIADKPVYHLHGSYEVLDDTYIPETINGFLAQQKENPPIIIDTKKHLYCNGIMAYSGKRKKEIIDTYKNGNFALDNLLPRIKNKNDIEAQTKFLQLKNSTNEKEFETYKIFEAALKNPALRCTEYPLDKLLEISGELHILGMSPNNDSHIFDAINDNDKITKVVYFAAGNDDVVSAQKIIQKKIEIQNVFKYWEKLGI